MTVSPTAGDRPVLPRVPEPADDRPLAGICDALLRGGFDHREMERLDAFAPQFHSILATRLRPELPALPTLIDLFRVRNPVRVEDAEEALGLELLTWLDGAGVLDRHGMDVTSNFRIEPYGNVLVMGDYVPRGQAVFEAVQAVTTSSNLLDTLTVRDPVSSMLDLGTGSGVLALRAASHAGRVVAVDLNHRAVALARFNAALNRVSNLELRTGSWLEPVQGDTFDLVVGNPPFIISPDHELLYRDSGDPAGEGMAALIRAVPDVLADGGIAQLLCQWPLRSGQAWVDPVREWAAGGDRRVLFVRLLAEDIVQYVARAAPKSGDDQLDRATVRRWLAHFDQIGVEAMVFGMVVIQRRLGPGTISGVVASYENGERAAAHVRRLLLAADQMLLLEEERAVLGHRFSVPEGLQFEQTAVYHGRRYTEGECVITDPRGLRGLSARVPNLAVAVLRGCAPETTLREAVEQCADRYGLDRDALARPTVAAARELVAKGLLAVKPSTVQYSAQSNLEMTTAPTTDDRPTLPPVPELDEVSAARLRETLATGGYGERQIQRFGKMSVHAWPVTASRLWPDLPALGTLIALFRTGQAVGVQDAEAALGGDLTWLCDVGVLVRDGSEVRSNLRIEPYEDLLITGDYELTDTPAFDTVQAMTPSAQTLDGFTIRDPVGSMLDLGIGSGVQALRAANRVERVVGADLNPRALAFARFNAVLNSVSNLELRQGSWLEPVGDDRFDLVLANLPFIIGPDFDLLYRNSGDAEGESFAALIKALPDVLADGGIAQAFCHWPIRAGQSWVDPLRSWTEGVDHRAVFIRLVVDDVAQYSARSVRMKDNDHNLYRETVDRWLRHFDAMGIEAMGFGMVAIQRRPGPVRRLGVAALADHRGDAAGAHVRRLLEAADATAPLEDERTALAQRVSLLDGHELGTTAVYRAGTYAMGEKVLIMDPNGLLGLSVQVPAGIVEVLRACGPQRTLAEVVEDVAQRGGVDRDVVARASIAAVRELAAKGLLTIHT